MGESSRENVFPSLQNPPPSIVSHERTTAPKGTIILSFPLISLFIMENFKNAQCKHNSLIEIPRFPSPHFNNDQAVPFSAFPLHFHPLSFYY